MSLPWTNKRFWALALLTLATVLYRGVDIYRSFFSSMVPRMVGVATNVVDGEIVVDQATAQKLFGHPTVASQAGLRVGDRIQSIYNAAG
ncbi:MAG: hypothetical protein EHM61_28100, partial [Acidobacteria bacterium]